MRDESSHGENAAHGSQQCPASALEKGLLVRRFGAISPNLGYHHYAVIRNNRPYVALKAPPKTGNFKTDKGKV